MAEKFAQLIIGPAGSGKSTYCTAVQNHCFSMKRSVHVVNLDPAAEVFKYKPAVDIRDLISLEDAMDAMNFGPNGGLVFCMEYLTQNFGWFEEQIVGSFGEDYILIDCPGQIELYIHLPVLKNVTQKLEKWGYRVVVVCLMDSMFITSPSKFISGTLSALSAMMQLALPHINVLSKCDLLPDKKSTLNRFFNPPMGQLLHDLNKDSIGKFRKLNEALSDLITSYSLTAFIPLDLTETESLEHVLSYADHALQYGEGQEPKEIDEKEPLEDDFKFESAGGGNSQSGDEVQNLAKMIAKVGSDDFKK